MKGSRKLLLHYPLPKHLTDVASHKAPAKAAAGPGEKYFTAFAKKDGSIVYGKLVKFSFVGDFVKVFEVKKGGKLKKAQKFQTLNAATSPFIIKNNKLLVNIGGLKTSLVPLKKLRSVIKKDKVYAKFGTVSDGLPFIVQSDLEKSFSQVVAVGVNPTPTLETTFGTLLSTDVTPTPGAVTPRLKVGVWDLGAWLGRFPEVLERMESVQSSYDFVSVQAAVPVGFLRRREGVIEWAGEKLAAKDADPDLIKHNVIAEDFFTLARRLKNDLKVDYIVGVTPGMVAGEDEDEIYWNHFSTFKENMVLASTYELRAFAKQSKHRFEALLAGIIVAQLLVAQFNDKGLEFHQDRGCLFDYNEDRTSLIKKIKSIQIEPKCLAKIEAPFDEAAISLLNFLKNF